MPSKHVVISGVLAGLAGAAVTGLSNLILNRVLSMDPPLDLALSLSLATAPSFIAGFLGFLVYARAGYDSGWFFGALIGGVSGLSGGLGHQLSYGLSSQSIFSLMAHGLVGTMAGLVLGAIAGFFIGPALARLTGWSPADEPDLFDPRDAVD